MSNYNYRQFMRKYRILITSQSTGVDFDVSDLRCSFTVDKRLSETPDHSVVAVYNVSEDSINAIQPGDKLVIEAGYKDGNYGMIFVGKIVQAVMKHGDSVDSYAAFICTDGDQFLTQTVVCTTMAAGATASDIVKECITTGGDVATGDITDSLSKSKLSRGKVLFGKSADYLSQIAKGNNAQFYVEDGRVNIVAADSYDDSIAVALTPQTGLIGTPEQTDDGISAKCLLNPSLRLNTRVYIDTRYTNAQETNKSKEAAKINACGIYKVTKLQYKGDTRGDEWYCEFEAVSMTGSLLSGLSGDQTNPW